MKNKDGYFPQLTGIRAIAAYMVFVHHNVGDYKEKLPGTLYTMLSELHIGVTVFFVLSGFLIAYRYLDMYEFSKAWLYRYFKNRVARIYPMYFILTTCAFLYYHYNHRPQSSFNIYLLNITFLRGFSQDYKFTGLAQGWSLTVEECFYALAPLIFLMRKRINIWIMALFILGLAFVLSIVFKDVYFYGLFHSPLFVFTYTFLGRCIEFFIGIQLALTIRNKQPEDKQGYLYTLTGGAGIVACLYLYTYFPMSEDFKINGNVVIRIIINNIICAAFISILFYGLITEMNIFRKFLSTQLMMLLGKSSYIFYLIHLGFMIELIHKFIAVPELGVFAVFIIVNIISVFLYKSIEQPLNNYIRAHFN